MWLIIENEKKVSRRWYANLRRTFRTLQGERKRWDQAVAAVL